MVLAYRTCRRLAWHPSASPTLRRQQLQRRHFHAGTASRSKDNSEDAASQTSSVSRGTAPLLRSFFYGTNKILVFAHFLFALRLSYFLIRTILLTFSPKVPGSNQSFLDKSQDRDADMVV